MLGFVPQPNLRELNSDSNFYSGSNVNNGEGVATHEQPWMDHPNSMLIKLPPLAGVIFSSSK